MDVGSATTERGLQPLEYGELSKLYERRSDRYSLMSVENIAIAVGLYVVGRYVFFVPTQYAALFGALVYFEQRLVGCYFECIEAKNRKQADRIVELYREGLQTSLATQADQRTLINQLRDVRIAEFEEHIRQREIFITLLETLIQNNLKAMKLVNEGFSQLNEIDQNHKDALRRQRQEKQELNNRHGKACAKVMATKAMHIRPESQHRETSSSSVSPSRVTQLQLKS